MVRTASNAKLAEYELTERIPMKPVRVGPRLLGNGVLTGRAPLRFSIDWISNGVWAIKRSLIKNVDELLKPTEITPRYPGVRREEMPHFNAIFHDTTKHSLFVRTDKTREFPNGGAVLFMGTQGKVYVANQFVRSFKLQALFGHKTKAPMYNALDRRDIDFAVMPVSFGEE